MLNATFTASGEAEALAHVRGIKANLRRVIVTTATEGGEQMRTYAVRTFRTIHSPTSTRRITGNLAGSYASKVKPDPDGATLSFGLLRSSAKGKALIYGPVQEFGAKITAKVGRLKFRLFDGSWRSAKSVTIPPRPAISTTDAYYRPVLERVLDERIEAVL